MSRLALALALVAALVPQLAHADDDDIPTYACKAPSPGTKLSVTFKPETDLRDLVTWAIGFTCKNIVIDSAAERYGARMTVVAPNKLTPKQALALFVDAVEATGLVVVQKADTIIIKLGPNMPRDCVAPVPPPVQAADISDAELAAGIKVIDDTHREMAAALRDRVFENPMGVAKGARIVPNTKNGRPYGFKVYAVRAGSLFERLGFANGDTIVTLNGFDVSTPDKALEVYTRIRDAKRLDIAIERRGKPLTIVITIKD